MWRLEADLTQEVDAWLATLPDRPAVFLLHPREGAPYLARTARLRRRLHRLLAPAAPHSRWLNLREIAVRAEIRFCASRLGSDLLFYTLARQHFPDSWTDHFRLRYPAYVKLLTANPWPRTQVTIRPGGGGRAFGPFRSRAGAERFEQEMLELFQLRRCQEDLAPSPAHPGCIYGEMNRCSRPCQQVVGREEYAAEAGRVAQFLATGGAALAESVAAARDRYSGEMQFEAAARQHERWQRVEKVLSLRDELAADLDHLYGIAVTASPAPGAVELRFLLSGQWQPEIEFAVAPQGAEMIPLERRTKEIVAALAPPRRPARDRAEHLAILARWGYSSWRDGEWIPFDALERIPYRRLTRAISKVASGREE
jgi:excinuclease UvrABC nuclease subunit